MPDEAGLIIDVTFHEDATRIAAAAEQAEASGVVGGLFVPEAVHDPFISLALAASATARLQLGTAVAIAFARTPMSMAYSAYDLHRVAGGRTILGLGSQIKPHIAYRYGMPWSRPAERMREYIAALRAIWHSWQTGERLAFRGDFYTHTLMPPLFSPGPLDVPSPPIWLAGVGPRMVEVAATAADGIICHPLISHGYLRDVLVPHITTSRAAAGLSAEPFDLASMGMVATGRTEEALETAIAGTRQQIGFYASTPAYKPVLDHHGWGALHDEAYGLSRASRWSELKDLVDDEVLNTFAVVGELDAVGAALRSRFGGLVSRLTLSLPYEAADSLAVEIAAS